MADMPDPLAPEFLVNTQTNGNQYSPAIAALPSGGFIVTWASLDVADDTNGPGVKGRVFDASGAPVGEEFLVNTETDNDQSSPSVAATPSGGFVVAWQSFDGKTDTSGPGIKARIFDANGDPINDELLVNAETNGKQINPSVDALPSGGFVVTWESNGGLNNQFDFWVKGRVFDATGDPVGDEFLINTDTSGFQWRTSVAALSSDGFVVTWQSSAGLADSEIKGQNFDASGAPVGEEFLVNTETDNDRYYPFVSQYNPSVSALPSGGFVVAWVSDVVFGGVTKGQVFDADGRPVGEEFSVDKDSTKNQSVPSVAALPDGGFVVAWESTDTKASSSASEIRGQVFDASRTPVGEVFRVRSGESEGQTTPAVAALHSGGVVVTFRSDEGTADTSGSGIYARLFTEPPFTPTLDLNGAAGPNAPQGDDVTLAYTEGDGAVAVAPDLTLADPDGGPITALSVRLDTQGAGDALALSGTFGSLGTVNKSGPEITLSGSFDLAGVEAALRAVTFANGSDAPGDAARQIEVSVTGGTVFDGAPVPTVTAPPTTGPDDAFQITGLRRGTDPDIADSESVPSLSIGATGDGSADWYWLDVTEDGTTATFDVDYPDFDPVLELFVFPGDDPVSASLADLDFVAGDAGFPEFDAFVTKELEASIYFVRVSESNFDSGDTDAISSGDAYELQVSLEPPADPAVRTATVEVEPVNDPPAVSLDAASAPLPEDADTSARIALAEVTVTDPDGGTNEVSLAGADAGLFEIDGGTLFLGAGAALDFETAPALEVTVAVDDSSIGTGPEDTADFALAVTDVNEAPSLALTPVVMELAENTEIPDRLKVADLAITDDALGTNVLTLNGTDADKFELDGTELFLKMGASLDFEQSAQLDVVVEVDDPSLGTTFEDSAAFALTVLDVNEAPSVGLRFTTSELAEDTDTSEAIRVGTIRITDDALGANTLSLSGSDANLFEIDGRALFLRTGAVLDFETNPVLDVTVNVSDSSIPASSGASLSINVTDVNEAPEFDVTQTRPVLPEGYYGPERTAVATVDVIDDGLGTNMVALDGEDAKFFQLEDNTLFLKAGLPLASTLMPMLDVELTVDDPTLEAGPEDSLSLSFLVPDTTQSGRATDDLLIGTAYGDVLSGYGGNDTLVGLQGDDLLDGGAGTGDVAVFTGPAERYTIVMSSDGVIVTDRREDGDGSDTLVDIETIRFAADPAGDPDAGTDFDLDSYAGAINVIGEQIETITQFYIGLFDRVPDAQGLFFWATKLAEGVPEDVIADAFIDSPEATAIYGAAPTSSEIVTGAYQNLLDRDADLAGSFFWTNLLEQGILSPAQFFTQFAAGVEALTGSSADRTTLDDQTDIGIYFSAIKGLSDVGNASEALAVYDLNDRNDSLDEAKDLIDDFATEATSTGSDAFLIQITGITDDPFASVA